ncbi:MAG TPA: tetratricopeptide repeat protein [Jatrophihabitantaceae bacterium]
MPRLEIVQAFVRACGLTGAEAAAWDEAWRDIQSTVAVGAAQRQAFSPRELPPDVAPFCGRVNTVHELDELLDRDRAPTLVAISGTAGVGKTALALHWAHRVAARFPDGQLYINLCGYDANPPITPESAVVTLLHSLLPVGAPVPAGAREKFALYRSLSADRSLLVVLDNAATPDDVRPLLPAGNDSVVIVTSRDAMAGLVARDGAYRIDLDALPAGDAADLLVQLVGTRAAADAEATDALAERCARLPLALRLAAELAIGNGNVSIRRLLDDLDHAAPLDELETGSDRQTSLRSVFSWSYQRLPADTARAFRLLGLHPGRSYEPYALAALADCTLADARTALRTLTRAHLLDDSGGGRYSMHDLLHAYAVELGQRDSEGDTALNRLLDFYIHVAKTAGDIVYPFPRPDVTGPLSIPATTLPDLSDKAVALGWLTIERPNLVAIAPLGDRWPRHVCALSESIGRYLNVRGCFADARLVHEQSARAARMIANRGAEGRALSRLGLTCGQAGALTEAIDYLSRARELASETGELAVLSSVYNSLGLVHDALGRHDEGCQLLTRALELDLAGDPRMEAALLNNLGLCHEHASRYDQALELYSQATEKYREAGWRPGEGEVFYNTGNVNLRLDRPAAALEFCERALAIAHETGSIELEMGALNSLGVAHRTLGQLDDAAARHNQALSLAQRVGDRIEVARALDGLGTVARLAGNVNDAHAFWTEALAIYTGIGVPQAGEVRAKLGALGRLAVAS